MKERFRQLRVRISVALVIATASALFVVGMLIAAGCARPQGQGELTHMPQHRKEQALIAAAKKGDTTEVQGLLAQGADPNASAEYGVTALMHAAANGHIAVVHTLLDARADVNAKDWGGVTALMHAAANGHATVVRTLLDARADAIAMSKSDKTALMYAESQRHAEVVRLLMHAEPVGKTYKLTVHTSPPDSIVEIMDTQTKYRPGNDLRPERYVVQVKKEGYKTARQWVTIRDADISVDITLQPIPEDIANRKYSLMSVEESRQLAEKIIRKKDGSLPDMLFTRGVKINDKDYVIFAGIKPPYTNFIGGSSISELFPYIPYIRNLPMKEGVPFTLNGILFSTVDIQVINMTLINDRMGVWDRENQFIDKGGYLWHLGPIGILLEKIEGRGHMLMAFETPSENILLKASSMYLVDFSILPENKSSIIVNVAEKSIQLK